MLKRCLLLLFVLISFQHKASAGTPIARVLTYDTAKISSRQFDQNALKKYAAEKAFSYKEDLDNQASFWDNFWAWFWNFLNSLFGNASDSTVESSSWRYPVIISVILLLVILIVRYMGGDLRNIFKKDSPGIGISYSETLENIHAISFNEEIETALKQHNYKLAVRLLYLKTLKQLNDAHLIHWQIEKTNTAYISELTNSDQRHTFGILTRQFEYVWYGDFPVDKQAYQNIDTLFSDFKKMIS